ncbi:MAG: hypothetical protein ACRDQG_17035 [Pseudonocardiaceae bacterium]
MFPPHPVPDWVVPAVDAVRECHRVGLNMQARGVDARDHGSLDALFWVTLGDVSPMTRRLGSEATWEQARAESWVALCVAAGKPLPTERDWQRLGVAPKAAVTDDREFAYGAWRALAWLLGVREDWPIHTAWHQAAQIPWERPHVYEVPREQWDTPAWRAADQASRDQAERDALRHWQHVRQLADATGAT